MSKARDIADLDFNSPDIDGGNIDGAVIGGTTPAAGTFSGLTTDSLNVGTTSDAYSSIFLISSATNGESELRMGDTDTDAGSIAYTNADNTMTFRAAAASRMTIDSAGIDVAGLVKIGVNNSEYANNYIRFKPTGAAYIDHNTVGQSINFRTSVSSSLDTTPLTIASTGAATFSSTIASAGVTSSNSITMTAGNMSLNSTSDGNQAFRYYKADGTLVVQQYPYNNRFNVQTYNNQGLRLKSDGSGQIELEGNVVINEDSANVDFRVESSGNANMLFVDGGSNFVGIGDSANTGYTLNVAGSAQVRSNFVVTSGGGANLTQGDIMIKSSTSDSPSARGQGVFMFNEGADRTWYAGTGYNAGGDYHVGFANSTSSTKEGARTTNSVFSLYNTATGAVFNENGLDRDFRVESDNNTHMLFVDGGTNTVGIGTSSPASSYSLNVSSAGNERIVIDSTNNTTSGIYMRVFNSGVLQGNSTLRVNNVGTLQAYMGNATSSETKYLDYIVGDGVGNGTARFKGNIGINHGTSDISDYVIATGADNSYRCGVAFQLQSSQSQWQIGYVKIKTGAGRTGLQSHVAAEYLYRFQVHNEGIAGIGLASSSGDTGSFTVSVTSQNPNTSTGTVELKIRTTASTAYGTHVIVGECHFYGGINKARREI